MTTTGGLDRIDVADQIGNRYIRGRQFFNVAFVGGEPGDRRGIFFARDQLTATPADRRVGVVVNLASRNIRRLRIEQAGKRTQDAALRLSAQSQQDKVMTR